MIKYGSLFTGAEGFDFGFNNAGMKCEWQVEIDQWCQAVLKYNSPNTEKFTDVRKVGKENLRSVDLICGGFPCQDLSVAGKRNGLDGERSGLWFEFARIIAELKPPWVVIENVPGLLSSNKGEDFAVILRWLGECGYYASWRVLDSRYWGVAQRRRRLFIVGSLGNTGCAEVLFESEGLPWNPQKGKEKGERIAATISNRTKGRGYGDEEINGNLALCINPGRGHRQNPEQDTMIVSATETGAGFWNEGKPRLRCSTAPGQPQTIMCFENHAQDSRIKEHGDISPTLHQKMGTGGNNVPLIQPIAYRTSGNCGVMEQGEKTAALNCATDPSQNIVRSNMAVRRLTPRECERLQGMPDDFTRYGINEKGEKIEISDSQRYKMAGNMVTRNVSEWIGRRIVEVSNP